MLLGKTVAVVIPAFNEEAQIGKVLENMPGFVDRIIVVNDLSNDGTANLIRSHMEKDLSDHYSESIGSRSIERNYYNEAEMVLQEHNQKEIERFVPSEVENQDPDRSRNYNCNSFTKEHSSDFTR